MSNPHLAKNRQEVLSNALNQTILDIFVGQPGSVVESAVEEALASFTDRALFLAWLAGEQKHGHHDQRTHGNRFGAHPGGGHVLVHLGGGKPGHNVGDAIIHKPTGGTIHHGEDGKPVVKPHNKPVTKPKTPKPPKTPVEPEWSGEPLTDESYAKNDIALRAQTNEWAKKMTTDERLAIKRYTGSAYMDMNAHLRFGSATSGFVKDDIKLATSGLMKNNAPYDMELKRGVNASMLPHFEEAVGGYFVDKGFTSLSIRPSSGWGSLELRVRVHKGAPGGFVDPFSKHPGEDEWLTPPGSKFKVLGIDYSNKKNPVVTVEYRGTEHSQKKAEGLLFFKSGDAASQGDAKFVWQTGDVVFLGADEEDDEGEEGEES